MIRRGIDTTYAASAGLSGASDAEHLAFGLRESRIVVTHDADLLRLASQGVSHAGIAFCHFRSRTVAEMLRALLLLCEFYEPEHMVGRVQYL